MDSLGNDTFYGDFMVKLVWSEDCLGFHGENMENQITRQSA